MSIAYAPSDKIEACVDALGGVMPEELQPLLHWFEDYYVGRPDRRGRRARPRFSPSMWSVYERTLNSEDRTNNHAEAGHRRLQEELGVEHPTLWRFIDCLRVVQKGGDHFYESLVTGHHASEKLLKY